MDAMAGGPWVDGKFWHKLALESRSPLATRQHGRFRYKNENKEYSSKFKWPSVRWGICVSRYEVRVRPCPSVYLYASRGVSGGWCSVRLSPLTNPADRTRPISSSPPFIVLRELLTS